MSASTLCPSNFLSLLTVTYATVPSSFVLINFYSFMRPNTPHWDLTQDAALVYTRHFYCSSVVFDSCVGVVHSLLADRAVRSTSHQDLLPLLTSLGCWFNAIQFERPEARCACFFYSLVVWSKY